MGSKERAVDRGTRHARYAIVTSGREIRQARLAGGLSQRAVGHAVGLSYSQVGRIERAVHPTVSVAQLARIASVVGLDLSVRVYPGPTRLRDAAHLALIARFRARLSPDLRVRTEVPLPLAGDQRAWDAVIEGAGEPIAIEAETRLSDVQALERRIALKLRDSGLSRVILVVAATRSNSRIVREAAASLELAFPVPGRPTLRALAAGRDPGGSSVILV